MEELSKLSHRGYTTGFLFGEPRNVGQEYHSAYIRSHEFVGMVEAINTDGTATIEVRNRIRTGDEIEFIGPGMKSNIVRVDQLQLLETATKIVSTESVNPNQRIIMTLPFTTSPFDLIRREKN